MEILFVFYNYGNELCFHAGIQVLSALAKREGINGQNADSQILQSVEIID